MKKKDTSRCVRININAVNIDHSEEFDERERIFNKLLQFVENYGTGVKKLWHKETCARWVSL